jgi:hypothetical protein
VADASGTSRGTSCLPGPDTKLFEQLQSGDANFWIKDVDVTRNHQTNAHLSSNRFEISGY